MKRIVLTLLLGVVLGWGVTDAELAVDINLAGKQRMLTQRMTKDVLMVVAGIEPQKAKEDLKRSMELFDRTIKGLMEGDSGLGLVPVQDGKVQEQFKKVYNLWKPFKERIEKVLSGKYSKEDLQYIRDHNMELLKEMNKGVQLLVGVSKKSKSHKAQAINLAGKERMLSQRIAKDILLLHLDPSSKEAKEDLQKSVALFEKILNGLRNGDKELGLAKTEAPWIVEELEKAQKMWEEFKRDMEKAKSKEELAKLMETSDKLLAQMNKITKMYEAIYNRRKKISSINSIVNSFVQEKENQKHIINLAGKQRMLTQKMTKEALLAALGQDRKGNMEALKRDMELYDKTLRGFEKGDRELDLPGTENPAVLKKIGEVQEVWKPFKGHVKQFLEKGDIKDLSYMVANNEELLKRSNDLVQTFKKVYPTNNYLEEARKEIVDIAGRQRMLTQKMTKEKLLILLGVKPEEHKKKLQQTVSLFDQSLHDLIHGNKERLIVKPTNKELIEQFKKVEALWKRLKPLYEKDSLSDVEKALIMKGNLVLLKEMDKAVSLCETVMEY
ncbi:MAG: hypothetical protein GXO19_00380 [Epsilonproteobacteria bacterium]|nr:hypothetical protein [Campylobacterota bacterium]NPA56168.1 hypothetical protein [Campylobacterota bacterium]